MKTYKLFDKKVTITKEERLDLEKHLVGWMKLYEFISQDGIDEEQLIKLIIIEQQSYARPWIISRLHSRYLTIKKYRQQEELEYARKKN